MAAKRDRNPKTAYICPRCRLADKRGAVHPGAQHIPGICDCRCRN